MNETVYTEHGPGTRGGMSWTKDWLAFDNAYYVELKEAKEAGEVREVSPSLSLSLGSTRTLPDHPFLDSD